MTLKLPGFSSSRTKRSKRTLYYVMIHQPSQVLVSTISPFKKEEKHQLGVSERVSVCKGNENNRKVASFPINIFQEHKNSAV